MNMSEWTGVAGWVAAVVALLLWGWTLATRRNTDAGGSAQAEEQLAALDALIDGQKAMER